MIALIQRTSGASVIVKRKVIGEIKQGLVVFLGVERTDTTLNMQKLADKIINYRIFSDNNGKMNKSLQQITGELLIISQFTLVADTMSGLRPSFSNAGAPEMAAKLYQEFISYCIIKGISTKSGIFGADMQVKLTNDGPVTFYLKM